MLSDGQTDGIQISDYCVWELSTYMRITFSTQNVLLYILLGSLHQSIPSRASSSCYNTNLLPRRRRLLSWLLHYHIVSVSKIPDEEGRYYVVGGCTYHAA